MGTTGDELRQGRMQRASSEACVLRWRPHKLIVTSNVHLLHCLDFSNPLRGFMYPVGIENSIFRLVIKRKKQVGCTCMHVCKQFRIDNNVCTHIEGIVKLFIERKYFFIMINIFVSEKCFIK